MTRGGTAQALPRVGAIPLGPTPHLQPGPSSPQSCFPGAQPYGIRCPLSGPAPHASLLASDLRGAPSKPACRKATTCIEVEYSAIPPQGTIRVPSLVREGHIPQHRHPGGSPNSPHPLLLILLSLSALFYS